MSMRKVLVFVLVFACGFAAGGLSFVGVRARTFPDPRSCGSVDTCRLSALLGTIAAAGIHVPAGLIPELVGESADCVGIKNPVPEDYIDLVFIPRRDVLNLLDTDTPDEPAVMDCVALMRQVSAQRNIRHWRIITNGPGYQRVGILHFHLVEDREHALLDLKSLP